MASSPPSSESSRSALRARALALDAQRLALEAQIAETVAELGANVSTPLVDAEGFPRADIDVPEVCRLRGVVARLRTDLKAKMKEVEEAMLAALAAADTPAAAVDAPAAAADALSTAK
jgi:26S proteasome non-ATPase regulatory subunit 9